MKMICSKSCLRSLSCLAICLATAELFGQQDTRASATPPQPTAPTAVPQRATIASELASANRTLFDVSKISQNPLAPNLARFSSGASVTNVPPPNAPATSTSAAQQVTAGEQIKGGEVDPEVLNLLDIDPTIAYTLKRGTTTVVLDLGDIHSMQSIFFKSFGAQGTLDIAVANSLQSAYAKGGSGWKSVASSVPFSKDQPLDAHANFKDSRFVKLVFNVSKGGQVGAFGIEGAPQGSVRIASISGPQANKTKAATTTSEAQTQPETIISHISSGNLQDVGNMVDDDFRTTYKFSPYDQNPVFVIDLGDKTQIDKASLLLNNAGPGHFNFYLMEDMPTPTGS